MSPPVETWPARELPVRVLATPDGRAKKTASKIDLDKCPLHELVQYNCDPEESNGKVIVRCALLVRTFRR